jgi:hypothetical protein
MGAIIFDPENGGTPALSGRRPYGYVGGALGNKPAFDPPLYICKSTRAQQKRHAGNMTRGRTVGAFPQTVSAFSDPLETRWSCMEPRRWN